eukprot:481923-Prymnesium_polylepis.1
MVALVPLAAAAAANHLTHTSPGSLVERLEAADGPPMTTDEALMSSLSREASHRHARAPGARSSRPAL